jgi:SPP1 gp7 family putative phage head morphogenesis protein
MGASVLQANSTYQSASGASVQVSLASSTAGSTIVVYVGFGDNVTGTTVADGVNGSYTSLDSQTNGSDVRFAGQYALQNNAGGALTITATFPSNQSFSWIVAVEVGGVKAASVDGHTSATVFPPATTNGLTVGPPSPNNANSPVLVLAMTQVISSSNTASAGTAFSPVSISGVGATDADIIVESALQTGSSTAAAFTAPTGTDTYFAFVVLLDQIPAAPPVSASRAGGLGSFLLLKQRRRFVASGSMTGTASATTSASATPTISGTASGTTSASGAIAGAGSLAGTAPATTSGTATLVGAGALAGTAPSSTSNAATPTVSGTASGSTSASGTMGGAGALAATAPASTSATASLAGAGALAGTASATTSDTATLAGAGAIAGSAGATTSATATPSVHGTASGTTSASGTMAGAGALAGASSASTAASGTLAGAGALEGQADAATSASATAGGAGALSGAASATTSASGELEATGALAGAASASTSATASLQAQGALAGTADAATSAQATPTVSGAASGTTSAIGQLTGESPSALSGNATADTSASGTLVGEGALAAAASATTSASATAGGSGLLAGTATATTSASATPEAEGGLAGTASATTGASANPGPGPVVGSSVMQWGEAPALDAEAERLRRGRRRRKTAVERAIEQDALAEQLSLAFGHSNEVEKAEAPRPPPMPKAPAGPPVVFLRGEFTLDAPTSEGIARVRRPTTMSAASTVGAVESDAVAHNLPFVARGETAIDGGFESNGFAAASPSPEPLRTRIAELEQQLADKPRVVAVQDAAATALVDRVVEKVVQLPPREIVREISVPVYVRIPVAEVVQRDVTATIYLDALEDEQRAEEPFARIYRDSLEDDPDPDAFEGMYDDDLEDADDECAPMADCPPKYVVVSSPTVTSPPDWPRGDEPEDDPQWRQDPVHAVAGGYQWGSSGKVYKSKRKAQAQAAAIYSSGWRGDAVARAKRRQLAKALAPPRAAEVRYKADLVALLGAVHRGVVKLVHDELLPDRPGPASRQDAECKDDVLTQDAGWVDKVRSAIGGLRDKVAKYLRPKVGVSFDHMAKRVDDNGRKAATLIGIRPSSAGLSDLLSDARAANIDLITAAGDIYLDQVADVLTDPENFALPVEQLAELLEERGNVSRSRAELIGVDQTLKTAAGLMQARHEAAGITSYIWSTSKDERVRPMHADLEGQQFDYDDPPETNKDGDTNNPGGDYRCRCVAIPLLEDEEAEPSGPESPEPEPEGSGPEEGDDEEVEPEAAE